MCRRVMVAPLARFLWLASGDSHSADQPQLLAATPSCSPQIALEVRATHVRPSVLAPLRDRHDVVEACASRVRVARLAVNLPSTDATSPTVAIEDLLVCEAIRSTTSTDRTTSALGPAS